MYLLAACVHVIASTSKLKRLGPSSLAADAELSDERLVTLVTFPLHIVEEFAAGGDHRQKPAAGVVVFFIVLEVIGQIVDPFGQDRDLDFRATRVTFGAGKFLDQFGFTLSCDRHRYTLFYRHLAG